MAYTCRTCRKELVQDVDYIYIEGIDLVENPECADCSAQRDADYRAQLEQMRRKEREEDQRRDAELAELIRDGKLPEGD